MAALRSGPVVKLHSSQQPLAARSPQPTAIAAKPATASTDAQLTVSSRVCMRACPCMTPGAPQVLRDKMRVTEPMLDAFFKAARRCARSKHVSLEHAARFSQRIIFDGTAHGILNLDTRCSAFVSLLAWCQEEEEELGELAMEVVDQIDDESRSHSPAVMAAIGSVFCSGTRSPY